MKISVLFLMVFVLVANSQKLGDNKVQAVNPFLWPYFSPRFTHPSFFYESIGGVPKNEIVLDPQPYYNYFKVIL